MNDENAKEGRELNTLLKDKIFQLAIKEGFVAKLDNNVLIFVCKNKEDAKSIKNWLLKQCNNSIPFSFGFIFSNKVETVPQKRVRNIEVPTMVQEELDEELDKNSDEDVNCDEHGQITFKF